MVAKQCAKCQDQENENETRREEERQERANIAYVTILAQAGLGLHQHRLLVIDCLLHRRVLIFKAENADLQAPKPQRAETEPVCSVLPAPTTAL